MGPHTGQRAGSFPSDPYSKERETPVRNKVLSANQRSEVLERTHSFVNQITTYFRVSLNEVDNQKQPRSQWFAAVLGVKERGAGGDTETDSGVAPRILHGGAPTLRARQDEPLCTKGERVAAQ